MKFPDKKLRDSVITAYKKAYFYKNVCDIELLENFEDLPIISAYDIKNQGISLLADVLTESPYYAKTSVIDRYFSKSEIEGLTKKWNIRLRDSKRVMCLFDKEISSYFNIFRGCNVFVYPRASFDSCNNCFKVIEKYEIDTIIGVSGKVLTLAQYIKDNNINVNIKKIFLLDEFYHQDAITRIQRYMNTKCICIKIIPSILIEVGELNDYYKVNKNIYAEIVETDGDKNLPLEQFGELVITLTDNTVQPIIRYSTGQKTRLIKPGLIDINAENLEENNQLLEDFIYQIEEVIDYSYETLNGNDLVTLFALGDVGFSMKMIEEEIRTILCRTNAKVEIKYVKDYVL